MEGNPAAHLGRDQDRNFDLDLVLDQHTIDVQGMNAIDTTNHTPNEKTAHHAP